jgi:hypothetical protein
MTFNGALIQRLRGIRRGYKFAILLAAAWAPLLLPNQPLWAGLLMASMTTIFFLATKASRDGAANSIPTGKIDAPS